MERDNQMFFKEFFCARTRKWKHVLVPSLQHVTMVKVAIVLWNQIDVRDSILNFEFDNDYRVHHPKWREVEEKVLAKAAQLPITEVSKKDLLSVISPIGVEIKNWWVFHKCETGLSIMPNRLSWTSRGTIDKLKTAECLAKDEEMDVDTCYKLACLYCMEDVIPKVWERLDEERKQYYYTIDQTDRHPRTNIKFLLTFWAYHMKGEASKPDDLHSTDCLALENAVWMGNKMAADFFFGKLKDEEKIRCLVPRALTALTLHSYAPSRGHYTKVLLFLLSCISEAEREVVLRYFPFNMLECLLEWPNRLLFVEMAERTLRSIDDEHHYEELLLLIIESIANGWSDCTSRQLFHRFWCLCPLSYKRRAIERIDYCTVAKLYEGNDVGIIRALFQHACAEEKEGLIMGSKKRDKTRRPCLSILTYTPSTEVMVKFKAEFLGT